MPVGVTVDFFLQISISIMFTNTEIQYCYTYFFFLSFQVEEALEAVKNATNEQDLANRFKEFGKEMVKLNYVAARRQQVGKILESWGRKRGSVRFLVDLWSEQWISGICRCQSIKCPRKL